MNAMIMIQQSPQSSRSQSCQRQSGSVCVQLNLYSNHKLLW